MQALKHKHSVSPRFVQIQKIIICNVLYWFVPESSFFEHGQNVTVTGTDYRFIYNTLVIHLKTPFVYAGTTFSESLVSTKMQL